jgi:hypothetical protein
LALLSLLLLGSLLLVALWHRYASVSQAELVVAVPATATERSPSRCPPRTLEDHGVCIPVPLPKAGDTDAPIVPLLPNRPKELEAYRLPVAGQSEWVDLKDAPIPAQFAVAGQSLAIATSQSADITRASWSVLEQSTLISSDPMKGWLLVGLGNPYPTLVLISGLSELRADLVSGKALPANVTLGRTKGTLFVAARQLLPAAKGVLSAETWQASSSVAVDLRNLLDLLHTP